MKGRRSLDETTIGLCNIYIILVFIFNFIVELNYKVITIVQTQTEPGTLTAYNEVL
jgi:hypothetical protein